MKQETASGSGISWAICKSAPRSRQITMPALHHSVFTNQMPFLLPNQHHQSTRDLRLPRDMCKKNAVYKLCVSFFLFVQKVWRHFYVWLSHWLSVLWCADVCNTEGHWWYWHVVGCIRGSVVYHDCCSQRFKSVSCFLNLCHIGVWLLVVWSAVASYGICRSYVCRLSLWLAFAFSRSCEVSFLVTDG